MTGNRHKRRFERWRSSVPSRTRLLVDAVLEILIPALEGRGFKWVDCLFGRNDDVIERPDLIPLRRQMGEALDVVQIDFSKRGAPTFVISFRRWLPQELAQKEIWLPHFLAKKSSEAYRHKRFGFTSFDWFVTRERCDKIVRSVVALLPQMDASLEAGTPGPNVTATEIIARNGIAVQPK